MRKPMATDGVVQNETLTYEHAGREMTVLVEEPAWYAWLETASSFTFICDMGRFTAHKAPAGNRRGGRYWRAHVRRRGRLTRCYLGVSANLTQARLREAACRLAADTRDISTRTAASAPQDALQPMGPAAGSAPTPILITKCTVPRLPVQHVPRVHLVAKREQAIAGPVTLVSAPAGSGKTTLLAEWVRTTKMPVAWLSLETADSAPARFLAYLLAALQTLDERIVRRTGALLETSA